MPVLSEQIAEVAPSVSVERRRLMIALASASRRVPRERIVVTTAGRPVGIAAIANATATVKTSVNVCPRAMLIATEATSASPAIVTSCLVSFSSWTVSGDFESSWRWSIPEMCPTSVAIAGGGDDELAGAAGDVGVHVDHVGAVAERRIGRVDGLDALAHRKALARQRGLRDLQRRGGEHAPVGGDDVAGLDRDDVPGHQLFGRDLRERRRRGARAP